MSKFEVSKEQVLELQRQASVTCNTNLAVPGGVLYRLCEGYLEGQTQHVAAQTRGQVLLTKSDYNALQRGAGLLRKLAGIFGGEIARHDMPVDHYIEVARAAVAPKRPDEAALQQTVRYINGEQEQLVADRRKLEQDNQRHKESVAAFEKDRAVLVRGAGMVAEVAKLLGLPEDRQPEIADLQRAVEALRGGREEHLVVAESTADILGETVAYLASVPEDTLRGAIYCARSKKKMERSRQRTALLVAVGEMIHCQLHELLASPPEEVVGRIRAEVLAGEEKRRSKVFEVGARLGELLGIRPVELHRLSKSELRTLIGSRLVAGGVGQVVATDPSQACLKEDFPERYTEVHSIFEQRKALSELLDKSYNAVQRMTGDELKENIRKAVWSQVVRMDVPGYESLAAVLWQAYDQAARGKGAERHANELPFEEQPMQTISQLVGSADGLAFQAIKKIQESMRLPTLDRRIMERLGAINYLAGLIIADGVKEAQ